MRLIKDGNTAVGYVMREVGDDKWEILMTHDSSKINVFGFRRIVFFDASVSGLMQ